MAVKMEIGISAEVALLAKVSIKIIKIAPREILIGTTALLLFPPIILEICGIKSPTHPTDPHIETLEAVIIEAAMINTIRILFIFIPRELASSSLRERMFNLHLNRNIRQIPVKMNGSPNFRLL